MTFETERLILRPFTEEDAETAERLAGDEEIARTTLHIPYPYPEGAAKEWIARHRPAAERGIQYTFALVRKHDNTLVGSMTIGVTKEHSRGELAYWIGRPFWNQGYATEAAGRLMEFGFDELGLNKVWAAAMTHNPGSSRVMEKIGMTYEGCLRHHVVKWGKPVDLAQYGILRSEYRDMTGKA